MSVKPAAGHPGQGDMGCSNCSSMTIEIGVGYLQALVADLTMPAAGGISGETIAVHTDTVKLHLFDPEINQRI